MGNSLKEKWSPVPLVPPLAAPCVLDSRIGVM